VFGLVVGACTDSNPTDFGDPTSHWTGPDGRPAPNGKEKIEGVYPITIAVAFGAPPCYERDELFLALAWPLGAAVPPYADSLRQYVWDLDNSEHFELHGTPAENAHPPPDAVDTGYRLDDARLWMAASDGDDYVYIERSATFQRWPRAIRPVSCM
jgi:hypothetical protein